MSKRKRGQNEGSIYQRSDGRWSAALTIGTGKRKYLYSRTAAGVRAKLDDLRRDIADGRVLDSDGLTVSGLASQYLASCKSKIKPSTLVRYESLLRVHILPEIGHTKLKKLQPGQIEALYVKVLNSGRAPQTVIHIHRVLHAMLAQALRWRIVTGNIASLVQPPRVPYKEMEVLAASEVRKLFEAASGRPLEALWHLAIRTGMRAGEMYALRWKDVDLDSNTLGVKSTISWPARQGWVLTEPKTKQSRRQIYLTDRVVAMLKSHRTIQLEQIMRMGPGWNDHDFVFASSVGTPLRHENVTRRHFKPLLRDAGLNSSVRVHDLRHTAITLSLGAGVAPTDVASMAGHSSVAVTLQRYAHALPGAPERAAKAIDTMILGN